MNALILLQELRLTLSGTRGDLVGEVGGALDARICRVEMFAQPPIQVVGFTDVDQIPSRVEELIDTLTFRNGRNIPLSEGCQGLRLVHNVPPFFFSVGPRISLGEGPSLYFLMPATRQFFPWQ